MHHESADQAEQRLTDMKHLFFNPVLAYNLKVLQEGTKDSYPSKFHDSELQKFVS